MKTSDIVLMVVNSVLITVSILASSVAMLWWYAPDSVDAFGKRVAARYVATWQRSLQEAEAAMQEQRYEEGASGLQWVLQENQEIKPGDWLAPIKRRAFEALVDYYERSAEYERALQWITEWIAFDGKDLVAQTRRARVLRRIPGHEAEGEDGLKELFARFPEAESVAKAYAELKEPATQHLQHR